MSETYSVTILCPVGGESVSLEVRQTSRGYAGTYEQPPEGPEFDWETPTACPSCGAAFDEETQAKVSERLEAETYNWYDNHEQTAPWDEGEAPDDDDLDFPEPDWETFDE